jgi:nitrite reductase/ring-hydroxylating ferredoxin subunit
LPSGESGAEVINGVDEEHPEFLVPHWPLLCLESQFVRIVVSRVDEFPPGERRIVRAGRRSIGVFRIGDRFFAVNNYCPHQGGPLCLGRTKPWLRSTGPGEYALDEHEALLACPWHGWEYDLATGQSFLGTAEPPARTYQVTVEPTEEPSRNGDRRLGPYVAETFPVHLEDAYVVVETNPSLIPPGGER